jgi:hypothetical protein
VKNVTFSAEDSLIERARLRAAKENRTLNAAFREWLERYAGGAMDRSAFVALMNGLRHVKPARGFSRDELNQR